MKNDPTGATGEALPVGSNDLTGGSVSRATSQVDESSTQNANGPAEDAISPSHSSPSAEKVEQMGNSSTAAPAARVDWCATANRYESALFKMKALTRNIESTMIENTGPIDGSPGSYAISEGVYEEIVAILSGMEAITERALEAA